MKRLVLSAIAAAVLACTGTPSQAGLVYDGFEAASGGGGDAYDSDGSIIGQGPARTGFSGAWSTSSLLAEGVVDFVARTDGLDYPGVPSGGNGRLELFRVSGSSGQGTKVAERTLSYTAPETADLYFAAQVSYSGSLPAKVSFEDDSHGRPLEFQVDGSGNLTVVPAGGAAVSYSEAISAGSSNLVVVRGVNDEADAFGGNPNTGYYDYVEIWINPTISGTDLGSPDATGYGIVRNLGGGGNAVAYSALQLSGDVGGGDAISVDEVHVTTDLADIVVPEPATLALLGIGGLGVLVRRRKA